MLLNFSTSGFAAASSGLSLMFESINHACSSVADVRFIKSDSL